MEQKKCVLIDQYPTLGGGQTVFLNLIRVCLRTGISVTALFPHGGELEQKIKQEFGNQISAIHIKELKLTRGRKNFFDFVKSLLFTLYFLKFLPLLKRHDYIYLNGPRLFLAALFSSYFINRPYIYHLHLEHSKKEKRLIALIATRSTTHRIIANSRFLYKQLCEFDRNLATNAKLVVIENSLTPALSCLPFRDRFQTGNGFKVGTFGRISYEKGQDLMIDAALQFPRWTFFLVGDGDFAFEGELRKRAPANLTFVGKVNNLAELIDQIGLEISVVPSRVLESFGLVAIESMAASCLTIVSDQGELPSVASRTSAFVFDSPGKLHAILQTLETKPREELRQIALEQFSKTREHYSFDAFAEKMQEVFRQ